ncbi:MAG: L-histidine N(alpha)-methyltransferase, partial [Acidobacteriota bacterium]
TLPEYYLTRTENAILEKEAEKIIALAEVECLVELGAGFSKKTVHLLSQQANQRGRGTFAPVDVSLTALIGSRDSVKTQFPQLEFHGLCAPYEEEYSASRGVFPPCLHFWAAVWVTWIDPTSTGFFSC